MGWKAICMIIAEWYVDFQAWNLDMGQELKVRPDPVNLE